MIREYDVSLTLKELMLIDGKVGSIAQKVIDRAKTEDSFGFEFTPINEIILKSLEQGQFNWRHKGIACCHFCDKKREYYKYTRSSRNHRKGDNNYSNPKYHKGVKFNEGFVTVVGSGDMCADCEKEYKVIESINKYVIDNDLKIELQDKKATRYIKDRIRVCFKCGKEMQESQMTQLPALMSGTYPGGCPHCGAEALVLGRSHETTNKFVMVVVPK
jgi:DNA-directed RNA polymerase subunit RPC12/RpoP